MASARWTALQSARFALEQLESAARRTARPNALETFRIVSFPFRRATGRPSIREDNTMSARAFASAATPGAGRHLQADRQGLTAAHQGAAGCGARSTPAQTTTGWSVG